MDVKLLQFNQSSAKRLSLYILKVKEGGVRRDGGTDYATQRNDFDSKRNRSKSFSQIIAPSAFFPDIEISIAMTKMSFYNSFSNVRERYNNKLKIKPGKKSDYILI